MSDIHFTEDSRYAWLLSQKATNEEDAAAAKLIGDLPHIARLREARAYLEAEMDFYKTIAQQCPFTVQFNQHWLEGSAKDYVNQRIIIAYNEQALDRTTWLLEANGIRIQARTIQVEFAYELWMLMKDPEQFKRWAGGLGYDFGTKYLMENADLRATSDESGNQFLSALYRDLMSPFHEGGLVSYVSELTALYRQNFMSGAVEVLEKLAQKVSYGVFLQPYPAVKPFVVAAIATDRWQIEKPRSVEDRGAMGHIQRP